MTRDSKTTIKDKAKKQKQKRYIMQRDGPTAR